MIRTGNLGIKDGTGIKSGTMVFYTDAREFITIIGPDGRPLVVPRQNNEQKETTKPSGHYSEKLTTPVTSTAQDLKNPSQR